MTEFRDKASNYHVYNAMNISALKGRIKHLYKLGKEIDDELQTKAVAMNDLNALVSNTKLSKLDKRNLVAHVIALQDIFDSFHEEIMSSCSSHKERFMTVIHYR